METPPDPVDTKKALLQQLKELNCSIEGDVDDIEPSEAHTVRNYMIKYMDYVSETDKLRRYSDTIVKDYPSVKSIFSRRSQFNDTKTEFHNQL